MITTGRSRAATVWPVSGMWKLEALDRVVDVEAVLGARGRLHRPHEQLHAEPLRHRLGQQGLAGPGLPAHQERPLQRHGQIDRGAELLAGDIAGGALEPHRRARR
jgi:hypothetical protein